MKLWRGSIDDELENYNHIYQGWLFCLIYFQGKPQTAKHHELMSNAHGSLIQLPIVSQICIY
jgi:hypothetical protein